jgi:putative endonuclease
MAGRPAAWQVYLLRCGDGSLYAGATSDLARRVARHATGQGARYTRSRLPVVLVHAEPARDRGAALRREAALKRLTRREKLAVAASQARTRPAAPPVRGQAGRPGRLASRRGPTRDIASA